MSNEAPEQVDKQPPPALCPRCGTPQPTVVTLTHHARGIVYQGCSNCLISELDALSSYRAAQCSTCGTIKVEAIFSTGARRMECPVHVQSRELLGRAVSLLNNAKEITFDQEFSGKANGVIERILACLGAKRT